MIGRLVVEAIPYTNFREKIRITKANKNNKMEITKNFILVWR